MVLKPLGTAKNPKITELSIKSLNPHRLNHHPSAADTSDREGYSNSALGLSCGVLFRARQISLLTAEHQLRSGPPMEGRRGSVSLRVPTVVERNSTRRWSLGSSAGEAKAHRSLAPAFHGPIMHQCFSGTDRATEKIVVAWGLVTSFCYQVLLCTNATRRGLGVQQSLVGSSHKTNTPSPGSQDFSVARSVPEKHWCIIGVALCGSSDHGGG